jgi:PAS domain S-box-containing protein
MTLRAKTLAAVGLTLVSLLVLLDAVSQQILLHSFGELEQVSVQRDVQRGCAALENELAALHVKAGDWSSWDDTYAFVEDVNPAYITSNLTDTAFHILRINLLLFINSSGRIVFAKAFDYEADSAMALPAMFQADLSPDDPFLQAAMPPEGVKGILPLPEGLLLLAARPILTSEAEGPARGTLVMGRYLDDAALAQLSALTQLSLSLRRLDDPTLPADYRAACAPLSAMAPIAVRAGGPDSIAGYTVVSDLLGHPALVLRTAGPREIYRQELLSARALFVAVLTAGLVFCVLTLLLVERLVLARVARLSRSVTDIATSGDFSARVALRGADELASLAGTVDSLLAAVQRSEQALQESQRAVTTLMSNLPGMAYRCRNDGHWTMEFVSEGCRNLTGYEPAELTYPGPIAFGQLIHPDDRESVWNEVQAALQERRPYQLVYRLHTAAQEEKWVWEKGRGILAATGALTALEGFIADITDTKRLEEALRAANEYNRSVIEACLDPLVVLDTSGRITDVNAAAQLLVGRTREELLGTDSADCVTDPDRARAVCAEALQSGAVRDYALEIRHRDGHTTPVLCSASVYRDHAGDTVGVCAVLRDVTERRRVETELKQAHEAAEAANLAKTQFLANMSHELRTPMTAVLGYVDLIAEGCSKRCEFGASTLAQHVDSVTRNAKYLLQLINEVLDLSKIEAGKLQTELVRCSLPELLADIESLVRVRATSKGLTLSVECAGPIPETICTDPTRLRQILINLLGNALKFTEQGSVRLVVTPRAGDILQFDVVDTGIGLTSEQITRLFQPFTQGDASIHRRYGGTGLGLSISRRLIQMLGGEITVESQPGAGSTFRVAVAVGALDGVKRVSYPSGGGAAQAAPADRAVARPKLNGRILLAEDGPDNQRLITLFLQQAGLQVTAVENGQMAVEAALRELEAGRPFDVILMDMQMPVLSGFDATTLLRQKGYRRPIVALTAHAMAGDREKCIDAGCNMVASKPIERAKLLGIVATHLPKPAFTPTADSPPAFLAELSTRIAALQRCLAAHDLGTLATLARELRSAADVHRLGPLTECAQRLAEAADLSGDFQTLQTLVQQLVTACQNAQVAALPLER